MQQNNNRTNTEETSCVGKCCQHNCDYVMNNHLPKILQKQKNIINLIGLITSGCLTNFMVSRVTFNTMFATPLKNSSSEHSVHV